MFHRLPTTNCPSINPRKKGSARWKPPRPPYRSKSDLHTQARKRGPQTRLISQEEVTAKARGCRGHQGRRTLSHCRRKAMPNPTKIAINSGNLPNCGELSQLVRLL